MKIARKFTNFTVALILALSLGAGVAYALDSDWWYYTKSSTALGKWVSSAYRAMNCRVGSIWCGWGQTDHWYGNGYTRYNTWYTPNQRV